MSRNVKELEEKIGYNFKDSHLLRHAVTHSSYVNEKHMKKADCNERLEFLGDAVLELISSEYLFFENQTMPEGELTKLRASMVCEKALAFCARFQSADMHLCGCVLKLFCPLLIYAILAPVFNIILHIPPELFQFFTVKQTSGFHH